MERLVKGLWIPIEIWKDKNLSWNERILLIEIDSFTSQEKDCYISNEYISKLLNVTETSANKILSSLIKKGYVTRTMFDGRRRYVKSNISISCNAGLSEETRQGCSKEQGRVADNDNIPNTNTNNNYKEESISKDIPKKENDFDLGCDSDSNSEAVNAKPLKNTYKGEKVKKCKSFNFRQSVIDLGVDENVVDDWLMVRKLKKAANTATAFNAIQKEINQSPISSNACITIAVERNWCGFKSQWLDNVDLSSYKEQKTDTSSMREDSYYK